MLIAGFQVSILQSLCIVTLWSCTSIYGEWMGMVHLIDRFITFISFTRRVTYSNTVTCHSKLVIIARGLSNGCIDCPHSSSPFTASRRLSTKPHPAGHRKMFSRARELLVTEPAVWYGPGLLGLKDFGRMLLARRIPKFL